MIRKVQHVEKLLAIKGVGLVTIAGLIAEIGDIRSFKPSKQIEKYTGLELVENSSEIIRADQGSAIIDDESPERFFIM